MTIERGTEARASYVSSGKPSDKQDRTPGVALSMLMLFAFLGIVFGCAAAGGAVTAANIDPWYMSIAKPDFTPADWVFPIVWNFLFFLMGLAGWLIWRRAGAFSMAGGALSLFGAQLMLNFGWTVLFFGLHRPGLALLEILILDVAIAVTIWAFWLTSRLAAALLVPYLIWSLFTSWLTAAIWLLNS